MRSSADDIPTWLAGLSDRALQRFYSRLTYLLRVVDAELQARDAAIASQLRSRTVERKPIASPNERFS